MSESRCKNCEGPLAARADFCPSCGQSVKAISRPWLEFAREMLVELIDFDGRMLRSMRLLLTRPGFLSYEYINGRRVAYTSPVRIYIVISLVYFVIALHTFYRESWPKSILKFFALQLIFLPILAITIELASHTP